MAREHAADAATAATTGEDAGRLPTFLIAGVMKCGTTALSAYLRDHPQVYVSPVKEVHFFNSEANWEKGLDHYRGFFADADGAVAVGEATPNYLYDRTAVARIRETLPEALIVVILRDPADRAYSHYLHWRERENRESRTFEQAVDDELSAGAPWRPDDQQEPYFGYLARGHYLRQLEHLVSAFGRDRVLVLLNDDLEADPTGTFRTLCRFLGVDDSFVPERVGQRINSYREARPRWLFALLRRYRVVGRLPPRAAAWLVRRMLHEAQGGAAIDPAVRARLAEHFEPANRELAAWLGRDLAAWLPQR